MTPFLLWLEATRVSVWVRESTSVMGFPAILSAHAIGMGLAVGVNATYALRLLGFAPGVPGLELKRFSPVMWFGFWLNAASGILLLLAYPTKALTNPVFYLKLALIVLAMGLFVVIRRRLLLDGTPAAPGADERARRAMKFYGAAALVCWAGAITAGRLLAYTYSRLTANW
jgi:hypothetical protein